MDREGKIALINTYRKVMKSEERLYDFMGVERTNHGIGVFDDLASYIEESLIKAFELPDSEWLYPELLEEDISAETICDMSEGKVERLIINGEEHWVSYEC